MHHRGAFLFFYPIEICAIHDKIKEIYHFRGERLKMGFVTGYIAVSVLTAIVDIVVAVLTRRTQHKYSRSLAWACVAAAGVDLVYLVSILTNNYTVAMVSTAIYLFGIDAMLNLFVYFVWNYIRPVESKYIFYVFVASMVYMLFEGIVLLANTFWHIMFYCIERDTPISRFTFVMLPLGKMHLIYTYTILAFVLVVLVWKVILVPKEYKNKYALGAASVLLAVLINAVFLYLPDAGLISLVDVSVLLYSVAAALIYWCFFGYSRGRMLSRLKNEIFANVSQGIILFDYEDQMALYNPKAEKMLPEVSFADGMKLEEFSNLSGIGFDTAAQKETIQCFSPRESDGSLYPFRCDYSVMLNKKNQPIGKLFVLTESEMQRDLLTGFRSWDAFRNYAEKNKDRSDENVTVAICDIIGLSAINNTEGTAGGDKAVQELAELLQKRFRQDAYYIRGKDSDLILLCQDLTEDDILNHLNAIKNEYPHEIEYATGLFNKDEQDILKTIKDTRQTLLIRKLMNKNSSYYSSLTPLMSALRECDSDTDEHVRRTRMLGENLALYMHLSFAQVTRLSLLALLHDIGKIGIPLEILNKPDKLTPEERKVIKSHVEKGYQIAMSSPELVSIASEIRHHHEAWDGTGYPDSLSGEDIPLLSRIIAVVDSYDAIVSNRSYRAARSSEIAVEELRSNSGTQFDPAIVSAFILMLKENPRLAYSSFGMANKPAEPSSAAQETDAVRSHSNVFPVNFSRYYLDENSYIISIDSAFTNITGYEQQDIADGRMAQTDLVPEEDRAEYICTLNEQLATEKTVYFEHRIKCKDGAVIQVFCTGRVYFDSAVRKTRSEIIIFNIADTNAAKNLARAEAPNNINQIELWEKNYRRDSLTGLLNRDAFAANVEIAVLNKDLRVMLLLVDIDYFTQFNAEHDREMGDAALTSFAEIFSSALRAEDLVARVGGDKFAAALCLPASYSTHAAQNRAREIFNRLTASLLDAGYNINVTMGVSLQEESITSFDKLYEIAALSLKKGKAEGRNRLIIDGEEQ